MAGPYFGFNDNRANYFPGHQSRVNVHRYGPVFPDKFYHPDMEWLEPWDMFLDDSNRLVHYQNHEQLLIFTDGACLANGAPDARGGCGFVYGAGPDDSVGFNLEDHGPSGEAYPHTSNRAELRAVIAALRFRYWPGEGFRSLVIATDSAYVVDGATQWVRTWSRNGWRASLGSPVLNRDLWVALLRRIEELYRAGGGFSVFFWKIPRRWNDAADNVAKDAAATFYPVDSFTDIRGVLSSPYDGSLRAVYV